MERNRKLRREYAIFENDVKAEDKYRLTTPSKLVFKTREEAKLYAKRNHLNNYKILVVYGYEYSTKPSKIPLFNKFGFRSRF